MPGTTPPNPYKSPADFFEEIDEATTMEAVGRACDSYRNKGENWRSISDHIEELEE
jgi:hypothetical protein